MEYLMPVLSFHLFLVFSHRKVNYPAPTHMVQSGVMKSPGVKVVTFKPKYASAFFELNRQWIEQYFRMEPHDYEQLENPHESIVAAGGEIFFAVDAAGGVLGTCAITPHDTEDSFLLLHPFRRSLQLM